MYNVGSLYDTFNAKYLSYQQVAESFIPNDEYFQLLGNNHTLIMGPRGCGKTTLLKMLTPAGLHYWASETSQNVLSSIPFTAVYIPSDIQWKSQLSFLSKYVTDNEEFNEKVSDFLITTNIQIALCRTFHSLVELRKNNEEKLLVEDEICKSLINVWEFDKPVSSTFDDIELSLQRRVNTINSIVNKFLFQKFDTEILHSLPDYIHQNFFDVVKIGCKAFEMKFGLGEDHKWALCFDELEISPKFLQIRLLKFLRSVDQKFLFKLTTTPLFNLDNNIVEATQDNDFRTLRLWVHDDSGSKKWRFFCENLITNRLRRRFKDESITPELIFGNYNLDDIIKDELVLRKEFIPGAGKGSSVNFLFKALAERDKSFKQFLTERKINPQDPYSTSSEEDKSVFLKHKVNALYRYLFKSRTRKSPAIHYGVPYIYDIADGNPRLLIGLVDEVLSRSEIDLQYKKSEIPKNKQTDIILEVSKKHFNLIRNHPDSTLIVRGQEFNLANDILRKIGNHIYTAIIKDDFTKSVPTTFTIDGEIDQKVIRLLEHALYLGAIVYLDPIETLSNRGLTGKRFRLSYLLTPLFRIPNRVNAQINLKSILNISEDSGTDQGQFIFN